MCDFVEGALLADQVRGGWAREPPHARAREGGEGGREGGRDGRREGERVRVCAHVRVCVCCRAHVHALRVCTFVCVCMCVCARVCTYSVHA
jgi:hypothetical protein